MSKILIEFDTQDKSLSVVVGDKEMESVESIYAYRDLDYDTGEKKFRFEVTQRMKQDGVKTWITTSANEKGIKVSEGNDLVHSVAKKLFKK